jgi:hypothetical protein
LPQCRCHSCSTSAEARTEGFDIGQCQCRYIGQCVSFLASVTHHSVIVPATQLQSGYGGEFRSLTPGFKSCRVSNSISILSQPHKNKQQQSRTKSKVDRAVGTACLLSNPFLLVDNCLVQVHVLFQEHQSRHPVLIQSPPLLSQYKTRGGEHPLRWRAGGWNR